MAGVGLLLHRWRADRGLLVVLVLVVGLTAGLVGAVPRLLDRLALASLDAAVAEVPVDRSGMVATQLLPVGQPEASRMVTSLEAVGERLDEELDPALAGALAPPSTYTDSVRYDLGPLPGGPPEALPRKLTVRLQPGVEEHLTVTDGRLPEGTPGSIEVAEVTDDGAEVVRELPLHEFAATRDTAEALGLGVGDRRVATADPTGPILLRQPFLQVRTVVVELVGIVELTPPDEPVWFGDPQLHRAATFDTNSSTTVFATGLVHAAAATHLPGSADRQLAEVGVRWPLDRAGLLAGDAAAVGDAATALRTSAPLSVEQPRWSTGLDRLLLREAARRATAVEVLALAAAAVVGVAGALVLAIVAVLAVRRRDATALVRGRGASRGQLVAAAVAEFGLVVLVGTGLAVGVLTLVLPGGRGGGLPALVGAVALLVLVVGGLRDARRRLGDLLAERRRQPRPPVRQHVLDGLLVLVASIAVLALRRRGVTVDGEADPLVVAAPVLVAAAAAVVAARLAPLPLRAAEAAARRGRGMVAPVGLATAARGAGGGVLVVLLVLGLGVAGLAGSVHRTLVEGQARAALEQVGADVRVDAAPLSSLTPDWSPPPAVTAVADVTELDRVTVVGELGAQRVDVLLVDPDEVAALGGPPLPDLTWDGVAPAPLLLGGPLQQLGSPGGGDEVTIAVDRDARLPATIAGTAPRVLGRDVEDGLFVVLDRAAVDAVSDVGEGVTRRLVATDDPDAVLAAVADSDPDADAVAREAVESRLRDAPLGRGVRLGYLVAAVAAVGATAAALVLALAASAPVRRRRAAVLAALGASTSRVRATTLTEVVPLVATAAATGVALAGGIAVLLGSRLDLAPFTGTVDRTALVLPPGWVAVVLVVGAMLVAGVAAVVTQGRVDPGELLREGDG